MNSNRPQNVTTADMHLAELAALVKDHTDQASQDRAAENLLNLLNNEFEGTTDNHKLEAFNLLVKMNRDYEIGLCHFFGLGTTQNYERAYAYFHQCPLDERATYLLGQMHEHGKGVEQSVDRAVDFYETTLSLAKTGEGRHQALKSLRRLAEAPTFHISAAETLAHHYSYDNKLSAHYFHLASQGRLNKITNADAKSLIDWDLYNLIDCNLRMLDKDSRALEEEQGKLGENLKAVLAGVPDPEPQKHLTIVKNTILLNKIKLYRSDFISDKISAPPMMQEPPSPVETRIRTAQTHRAMFNNYVATLKRQFAEWKRQIEQTEWKIKGKLWGWNDGMPNHVSQLLAACERGIRAQTYKGVVSESAIIASILRSQMQTKSNRRHDSTCEFYAQVEREFSAIRFAPPVAQPVAASSHAQVQQALGASQMMFVPLVAEAAPAPANYLVPAAASAPQMAFVPIAPPAPVVNKPDAVAAVASLSASVPVIPKPQEPIAVAAPLSASTNVAPSKSEGFFSKVKSFFSTPAKVPVISNVRATEMDLLKPQAARPATPPPAYVKPAAVAKPKEAPPAYVAPAKPAAVKMPPPPYAKAAAAPFFLPSVANAPLEEVVTPLVPPAARPKQLLASD